MTMSSDEFGVVVEEALADLPETFGPYLENVVIEVQLRPDERVLRRAEIGDGRSLLGIYIGRPLTEKSVEAAAAMPDRIILFQRNLEGACRTRRQLVAEIRKTVYHEIGHHFGLDEDDLEALGYG